MQTNDSKWPFLIFIVIKVRPEYVFVADFMK